MIISYVPLIITMKNVVPFPKKILDPPLLLVDMLHWKANN